MQCSATFALNQTTSGDFGMDAAVYEPTSGFIFGVRGQWIFKCSATDGSIIASMRFCKEAFGWSSVTAVGGKVYVGVSQSPKVDTTALNSYPDRDVYKVDPVAFTSLGPLGLYTKLGFTSELCAPGQVWFNGYTLMVTDGTKIYSFSGGGINRFDPTNTATCAGTGFEACYDMSYDSDHGVVWFAGLPGDMNAFLNDYSNSTHNSGSISNVLCGLTYCSSVQKAYFVSSDFNIGYVDASNIVTLINTSTNFPFTLVNTGRINANPFRVKAVNGLASNPYNGKVLIPAWNDDTVLVWNTTTNNPADMVVKTGFTAPFDIVNCPNASFAVQTGPTPLQLI